MLRRQIHTIEWRVTAYVLPKYIISPLFSDPSARALKTTVGMCRQSRRGKSAKAQGKPVSRKYHNAAGNRVNVGSNQSGIILISI
jgi:hypothetical protein